MSTDSSKEKIAAPGSGCADHDRLLDELAEAIRELLKLHEQQVQAVIEGDGDCSRFDLLIHMANETKQAAKYAYLRHIEEHGCSDAKAKAQT